MWHYVQRTGALYHDSALIAHGYSGYGVGKNNPELEHVHDVGPITRGLWTMGTPHDTDLHGPYVISLTAAPNQNTWGRSGFLSHGDSKEHPGCASHGCIIMAHDIRILMWTSGDHNLMVWANGID